MFWNLISVSLFGLLVGAGTVPQHVEVKVGNTAILDLMRELSHAKEGGDEELVAETSQKLRDARSSVFGDGQRWQTECRLSASLDIEIYTVSDPHNAPKEVGWAMERLDEIWTKDDGSDLPYPGDFNQFMHPDGFRFLRMDYDELPWAVREWREQAIETGDEMDRKLIAVIDGNAFFAPAAVTYLSPLFAAKEVTRGKNACKGQLNHA